VTGGFFYGLTSPLLTVIPAQAGMTVRVWRHASVGRGTPVKTTPASPENADPGASVFLRHANALKPEICTSSARLIRKKKMS
jgi:hypothetical protein